jgi:hypothetical protein
MEPPKKGDVIVVVQSDDPQLASEGQEGVIEFVEHRRDGVFVHVVGIGKNVMGSRRFRWTR